MSLDIMASTRQSGQRMRVEAFKSLVANVKIAPADRDQLIKRVVDAAVNLNDQSKGVLRGECHRVTHPRVLPIFDEALRFSERVRAERIIRPCRNHAVQQVLLDVCKRVIAQSSTSPGQALQDLEAAYVTSGTYPPD